MKKPKGMELEGLHDFLKTIFGDDDEDELKQEAGVITKERIAEIIQIEYDTDDVKEEIHRKMEDYTKQLQRDYDSKILELGQRKIEWWQSVYKDIGSDGKGNHTLDRKTGVITRPITPMSKEASTRLFQ